MRLRWGLYWRVHCQILVGKTRSFNAVPDVSVDEDVEDGIDETVEVGQGHQVPQQHGVTFQWLSLPAQHEDNHVGPPTDQERWRTDGSTRGPRWSSRWPNAFMAYVSWRRPQTSSRTLSGPFCWKDERREGGSDILLLPRVMVVITRVMRLPFFSVWVSVELPAL